MKNIEFKGCGTALVTPFAGGEIDYEAYGALIDRQVEEGVDFLVPLGTTGETPTLSSLERCALLDITRDHAPNLPLLVGVGSNSVQATLANMELIKGYGADAYLVVVPFYNKPTQEGMYQYFRMIASNSDLPIVIYNVPGRTGANMLPDTVLRLAREVNGIIGIKEASGKIEQVKSILEGAPSDFIVLSGDDDLTLEMMKSGARGVISVASNIAPAQVSAMTHAALEAYASPSPDFSAAEAIDDQLKPLYKACFVESNPIPVKAGLAHLGLCTVEMRLPLTTATPATVGAMAEAMGKIMQPSEN